MLYRLTVYFPVVGGQCAFFGERRLCTFSKLTQQILSKRLTAPVCGGRPIRANGR